MDLEERNKRIYKITFWGSLVNLLLLFLKVGAGILGHSAAMIADATHSLADFVSDIVLILCHRLSKRPADEDHDYGHGKYETLATTFISGLLLFVSIALLHGSISDLIAFLKGEVLLTPEPIALVAALLSIVLKETMYRATIKEGKKLNSSALIANAWEHRSDALSSVGATLGIGGALLLGGSWAVLDAVAAILVSILIIRVALDLLRKSLGELLEKSLTDEEEAYIIKVIEAEPETTDPHSLRTRRIASYCAIDVHFRVRGDMNVADAHEITLRIEQVLRKRFGQQAVITTHVEPIRTACKQGCQERKSSPPN